MIVTEQTKLTAALARESIALGFQLHRREGDSDVALARLREIVGAVQLVVEEHGGDTRHGVVQRLREALNCCEQSLRWGEAIAGGRKYALHVGRVGAVSP